MDLTRIKNLIKCNGDKFIVMENGEPEVVMMSFQEYEKLNGTPRSVYSGRSNLARSGGPELTDFGLEELKETEFMAPQGAGTAGLPVRPEDVRLEDLPI